jgi:hypothetical protein
MMSLYRCFYSQPKLEGWESTVRVCWDDLPFFVDLDPFSLVVTAASVVIM